MLTQLERLQGTTIERMNQPTADPNRDAVGSQSQPLTKQVPTSEVPASEQTSKPSLVHDLAALERQHYRLWMRDFVL